MKVIPSANKAGFGGVIEGVEYLAVVAVLDDILSIVGATKNVVVSDLPDMVARFIDNEKDISWNIGYDEGLGEQPTEYQPPLAVVPTVSVVPPPPPKTPRRPTRQPQL